MQPDASGESRPDLARLTLGVVFIGVLIVFGLNALFGMTDEARQLVDRLRESVVPAAPVWLGGLPLVGVPFAGVLTAIVFMFCIAQLGPLLVMAGATAWTFHALGTGWGTLMLVWTLTVGVMDNFVRPVLIRRGADLPLLLIFAGVIGGLLAFGVVGIFVGPVVLAVAHTLLDEWIAEADRSPTKHADSHATSVPVESSPGTNATIGAAT
jgi:hypothetical protein